MLHQIPFPRKRRKIPSQSPVKRLAKVAFLRLQCGNGKEDDVAYADGVVQFLRGESGK